MDRIPMTQVGLDALEAEFLHLRSIARPAVIIAIAEAREHGDLKENAEYHAARDKQSFIEGRIAELESVISYAEVIDPATLSGDVVRFGASIELADEDTDEESSYQIVGTHQSNVDKGLLSITSPLAKALIGKSLGDSVEVRAPGGNKSYEIIRVTYR